MSVVTGRVVLGHWERGTAKPLGQRPLNQGIKNQKSLSRTQRVLYIFCRSFPTSPGGRGWSRPCRGKRGHAALQGLNPPARKYRGGVPPEVFLAQPAAWGRPARLEFLEKMPRPSRQGSVPQGPNHFIVPPALSFPGEGPDSLGFCGDRLPGVHMLQPRGPPPPGGQHGLDEELPAAPPPPPLAGEQAEAAQEEARVEYKKEEKGGR